MQRGPGCRNRFKHTLIGGQPGQSQQNAAGHLAVLIGETLQPAIRSGCGVRESSGVKILEQGIEVRIGKRIGGARLQADRGSGP